MNRKFDIISYLTFLCLALAVLTGCNKEPDTRVDEPVSLGTPISFTSEDSWTRAAGADVATIQKNGFKVWGLYKNDSNQSWTHQFGEAGTLVSYDDVESAWTYSPEQQWKAADYVFAAVTPPSVSSDYDEASGKIFIQDFDVTSQIDLMVAYKDGIKGSERKPVQLSFSHLLSKINIKVSQDVTADPRSEYFVTGVTINGVQKTGSYTGAWDFSDNKVSLVQTYKEPVLLKNALSGHTGQPELKIWGEEGILLMQQDLNIDAIEILLEFNHKLPGQSRLVPGSVKGYIPATPVWESGKSYTYSVSISRSADIKFSVPTIEPWANVTSSTIIVQ